MPGSIYLQQQYTDACFELSCIYCKIVMICLIVKKTQNPQIIETVIKIKLIKTKIMDQERGDFQDYV